LFNCALWDSSQLSLTLRLIVLSCFVHRLKECTRAVAAQSWMRTTKQQTRSRTIFSICVEYSSSRGLSLVAVVIFCFSFSKVTKETLQRWKQYTIRNWRGTARKEQQEMQT
jgi:hypothetical protein